MAGIAGYQLYPGMMGSRGRLAIGSSRTKPAPGGKHDFELLFTWEVGGTGAEGASPRVVNPDAPSIFTALEKQLGLKLEPRRIPGRVPGHRSPGEAGRTRRIPVEFLAIDHLERPPDN